mgnify:CR=1 FL=1
MLSKDLLLPLCKILHFGIGHGLSTTANAMLSIVYWTYLCVVCLESSACVLGIALLLPRGPRASPLRHRISLLSPQSIGILRDADVCPRYLSVYTTSPFLSSVLFFLVFSSPVPWLDLSDFFSTLCFFLSLLYSACA